jgi:hypothetical protein
MATQRPGQKKPAAKPVQQKPAPARPAPSAPAVRKSTAVAAPADLNKLLATDAGSGFEEAGRDAYAIPFLLVLQDLSPQTKKMKGEYVEGAKPGMIFNTVTKRLIDGSEGIWVIPAHWSQVFIEWVPRDSGGGFVGTHPPGSPRVAEGIRQKKGGGLLLPNGNQLMDTRQHFVIAVDPETERGDGVLIPFKSTGLKISRNWMSLMRSSLFDKETGEPLVKDGQGRPLEPPMFAWMYLLKTEEDSNDQGSWHQFYVAEQARVTVVGLYQQARAFGAAMKQGAGNINYAEMANRGTENAEGAPIQDLDDNVVED